MSCIVNMSVHQLHIVDQYQFIISTLKYDAPRGPVMNEQGVQACIPRGPVMHEQGVTLICSLVEVVLLMILVMKKQKKYGDQRRLCIMYYMLEQ